VTTVCVQNRPTQLEAEGQGLGGGEAGPCPLGTWRRERGVAPGGYAHMVASFFDLSTHGLSVIAVMAIQISQSYHGFPILGNGCLVLAVFRHDLVASLSLLACHAIPATDNLFYVLYMVGVKHLFDPCFNEIKT
jgi:hypothetical protein